MNTRYNLTISTTMNATVTDTWRSRDYTVANKNHAIWLIKNQHTYTLTFEGNYIIINKWYVGNDKPERIALGSTVVVKLISHKKHEFRNLRLSTN